MFDGDYSYYLFHKNTICGLITIDSTTGILTGWKAGNNQVSPFLGNPDTGKMKKWWMQRAVPGSRKIMEAIIRQSGCNSSYDYLAKNLGLSITDTYWIRPVDADLKWEDVYLLNQTYINEGKMPYHNFTSYDPNASLGGQMEKYWDLTEDHPILVKTASTHYGQQSINELFATIVHERQNPDIPYVEYSISVSDDGNLQSRCPAFTNEDVEFISAYEIIESKPSDSSKSLYNEYIDICAENGLDRELMQRYMDYQTLTDFVISNTDEHLLNFGVCRDPETCRFIGPAPIFDSGNSMFYTEDTRVHPFTRVELLKREITSFYSSEEKMLKNVKHKKIVKSDLLPTASEVYDLYAQNGLPESKAKMISDSYQNKVSMLEDFQNGIKISLYNEKKDTNSKQ